MGEDKPEVVFPEGMFFNKPHANAPEFVKGGISFTDVSRMISFLQEHQKENQLKLDLLKSRDGKLYFKLNTFVPKKKSEPEEGTVEAARQDPNDF